MSGVIYLVQGEGKLVPMKEQSYDSEDVLQRLLADYPDLLGGEQIHAVAPRRWLLLAHEAGLPSGDDGGDRWSVDHLFVDQDGIPTIIEVKRSTDTRIRREVVGQMLDYAANAVVYWPVERLRSRFEERCAVELRDPQTVIADSLDFQEGDDAFWKLVQTNLQAGHVRLIFVADVIPVELLRVVEYLNAQMNPTEVYAVEVRQYVGHEQQALVPRLIGQTQQAAIAKATRPRSQRQWRDLSKVDLIAQIHSLWKGEDVSTATHIVEWADQQGLRVRWREGTYSGIYVIAKYQTKQQMLFSYKITGAVTIELFQSGTANPFAQSQAHHEDLVTRLTNHLGSEWNYPSFVKTILYDPKALVWFLAIFEWIIKQLAVADYVPE